MLKEPRDIDLSSSCPLSVPDTSSLRALLLAVLSSWMLCCQPLLSFLSQFLSLLKTNLGETCPDHLTWIVIPQSSMKLYILLFLVHVSWILIISTSCILLTHPFCLSHLRKPGMFIYFLPHEQVLGQYLLNELINKLW